jgi:hypothetical protein
MYFHMFINKFITFVVLLINIWLSSCVACNLLRCEGSVIQELLSWTHQQEIGDRRKTTIETIFRHLDEFHYKNCILTALQLQVSAIVI